MYGMQDTDQTYAKRSSFATFKAANLNGEEAKHTDIGVNLLQRKVSLFGSLISCTLLENQLAWEMSSFIASTQTF